MKRSIDISLLYNLKGFQKINNLNKNGQHIGILFTILWT